MTKPNVGIFIGRFQPINNVHLSVINLALAEADHLIVILGSATEVKSINNPWTTEEREYLLRLCLDKSQKSRVTVVPVKDYLYNDNLWITDIQFALGELTISIDNNKDSVLLEECNVTLYGNPKDRGTNYLKLFPGWKFKDIGNYSDVSSKELRKAFFTKKPEKLFGNMPCNARIIVEQPILKSKMSIDDASQVEYNDLCEEFQYIEKYKEEWAKAPYPPTFNTADAVVIKSGHVLVVRRKGYPGKGLIALPGGFVGQDEFIVDSCIRELKEETGIALPKDELKKRITEQKVFDHPKRSLRGRTITHAFCINLGAGTLPKVKGNDDADKAWWMSLSDVFDQEENFFEDHFHIINYFCNRC